MQELHRLNIMDTNPTWLLMLYIIKRGNSVTSLAKTLLVVACASLLSLGMTASARRACAQDVGEADQNQGGWSAPDAGGTGDLSAKIKLKPLEIKGCWSGEVDDAGDGVGTATIEFNQKSNRKKLAIGSMFNFQWPDSAFAEGPMKGTVSATGFKFTGNAGAQCAVTGSGTGDATTMTGNVVFTGSCATFFQDVTFSITPGCL